MRGDDDPGRPRTFGAPRDRTEVPRVGHAVEADEQWARALSELVGVRVLVRLDPRDDALVVAVADRLGQITVGPDLDARPAVLLQPGLGRERPLGRKELEHLPRAAKRLAHCAPPVDLVCGHDFGTRV